MGIKIEAGQKLKLVKVGASQDARLPKASLEAGLQAAGLPKVELPTRHENDAIRIVLQKILVTVGTLPVTLPTGQTIQARLVTAPAKTSSGSMRIDIHLQRRGETVNYGHIGAVVNSQEDGSFFIPEEDGLFSLLPAFVQEEISKPFKMIAFGQSTAFDTDLRKVCEDVLRSAGLQKAWPGTFLATGEKQVEAFEGLQKALSTLDKGHMILKGLNLQNDGETLETLREEIASNFLALLNGIKDKLESGDLTKKATNKAIAEFEDLRDEAKRVQENLGVAFGPEWDEAETALFASLFCYAE